MLFGVDHGRVWKIWAAIWWARQKWLHGALAGSTSSPVAPTTRFGINGIPAHNGSTGKILAAFSPPIRGPFHRNPIAWIFSCAEWATRCTTNGMSTAGRIGKTSAAVCPARQTLLHGAINWLSVRANVWCRSPSATSDMSQRDMFHLRPHKHAVYGRVIFAQSIREFPEQKT